MLMTINIDYKKLFIKIKNTIELIYISWESFPLISDVKKTLFINF